MMRRQRGQSMVEFIIVLPILLLLSFGTIELGIIMQRQITMSGAAFVAARAAAVRGPEASEAIKEVVNSYAADASSPWIGDLAKGSGGKVSAIQDKQKVQVRMTKSNEGFSGLVIGSAEALGGAFDAEITIGSLMTLSQEYVPGKGVNSATRQKTSEVIDYQVTIGELQRLAAIANQLASLSGRLSGVPVVGPHAGGLVAMANVPDQAVGPNPGKAQFAVGRTLGDVYISAENETLTPPRQGLNKSELLLGELKKADQLCEGFRQIYSGSTAIPGTYTLVLQGISYGCSLAGKSLEAPSKALKTGIETGIFGARAK